MNRYQPHVFILPEDDCDRQLADGFVLHDQVRSPRVQVLPPAGGWFEVLKTFKTEYITSLTRFPLGFLIMLIDFDGAYATRRAAFEAEIPDGLKERVFVVGVKETPEVLRQRFGKSYEQIGLDLADECYSGSETLWSDDHLRHNNPDFTRLFTPVKPLMFND